MATTGNRSIFAIVKRTLLISVEVLLILLIIGLLVATWLPAWVGAIPGVTGRG